jgi:hypothetical protein
VSAHWPIGGEVLEWPEFQALMDRLGVEFPDHLAGVTLSVKYDCATTVTLTYYPKVKNKEPKT